VPQPRRFSYRSPVTVSDDQRPMAVSQDFWTELTRMIRVLQCRGPGTNMRICLCLAAFCFSFVSTAVSRHPSFVSSVIGHCSITSSARLWTRELHIRSSTLDDSQEVARKRERYFEERRLRERVLLSRDPTLQTNHSNEVPDYISRWGGADLANEGPTRKLLELMNDSEW
jgi:hypothetical protein